MDSAPGNGVANLTDFGGRTASAALPATVVDTTAPALAFSTDAARADDGTLALALTAEKVAKVTITAVRRGDDTTTPTAPVTDTLVGSGSMQAWSRALEPGTYELTAAAIDTAGNQIRQTRTVTITKPATAGEIVGGMALLLVLIGALAGLVALLWRKRQWVAATASAGAAASQRHGAATAERARQAAVAAAQARYAAAREQAMGAVHDADRRWKARRTELSEQVARWTRPRGRRPRS